MDKILGIICEYNPMHYGHIYHIQESKKEIMPDYTVAIMSGNFTQRGDVAIIDKWSRAAMALNNGVDLVIELPLIYSISSAENYASGSIKILDSLKMNTFLSFGSECGNLDILNEITQVLIKNPPEFVSILNHELSNGLSFPKAREHAILMYLNDIRRYANVLKESNNILGIEYLKAINTQKSNIIPVTIKRKGSKYNDSSLYSKYSSATAIRQAIIENKSIKRYIPETTYNILKDKIDKNEIVPGLYKYEQAIIYKLRTMTLEEISMLPDVNEGLENKIKKAAESCSTLEELIEKIKSKRYTQTRIMRILLYALLNITRKDLEDSYKATPYIRVLGVNDKGKALISKLVKKNKKLHIITSPKKFLKSSKNKTLNNMLETDISASNIYTLGYSKSSKANLDYTNKLITL